jgi:hypothetical protein
MTYILTTSVYGWHYLNKCVMHITWIILRHKNGSADTNSPNLGTVNMKPNHTVTSRNSIFLMFHKYK